MPIRHALWKVGEKPVALAESSLGKEALLEQMIAEDFSILSDQWLPIGRQLRTTHGGFIDLLAINTDGQLIVIELKRDQTPREVVAQAIDYASWAKKLNPEEIAAIFTRFSNGRSLGEAFKSKFGIELEEEKLDGSHQVVVVASFLDPSTERIINYLSEMDVPINVIFFQVFQDGAQQYLGRSWLLDPVETQTKAASTPAGPKGDWNGEWYVSFGHDESRDWNEARKYGFVSAGGGAWFTQTLAQLSPGDHIWVNVPHTGYVGVGRVAGNAVPARDFKLKVNGQEKPALEVLRAGYQREFAQDDEKSEYFVPVEWEATKPLEEAVKEVGSFGNQNTACRPRTPKWDHTVERLKQHYSSS